MKGKTVNSCGLFIDSDDPQLAATPDGLIDGEEALIEIKCPSSIDPDKTIFENVQNGKIKFLKINKEGSLYLKNNNDYYYQIQGQMRIAKRSSCYFVVWSPKDIYVEYIQRDETFFMKKMHNQLLSFYKNAYAPLLLKEGLLDT